MDLDVGRLVLVRGSNHPGKGFSVMEAVAFAAGEAWSLRPRCASPAVTEWMIAWNDGLDDVSRQRLRRYIWRLVGSRGTRADERVRQWMVADWLVRSYAPAWLAAAGLRDDAARLTGLAPLTDEEGVEAAWLTVRAAARAARAERDQAWRSADTVVTAHDWDTAGAVWAAIADATQAAGGNAARAVVWSATDPTAPGRVRVPVWDAVCDAAADAAGAIAWVAVRDAVRASAGTGPTRADAAMGPVQTAAVMIEAATPLVLRREAPAGSGIVVGAGAGRTRPPIDPLTAEWFALALAERAAEPASLADPGLWSGPAAGAGPDRAATGLLAPAAPPPSSWPSPAAAPLADGDRPASAWPPAELPAEPAPEWVPLEPVAEWVPVAPTYHPSPGGAGAGLPVAHPSSPVDLGGGRGHHDSHGEPGARAGRGGRGCTVDVGRAHREPTCAAAALPLVSGDQGMGSRTSSRTERRDSSPVVETRPDAADATAADDMEDPDALAEADDPSASDDMWQLAWETARAVLAPTSAALQTSAHDLVDRLIAVTE
ncbi:MAG TPA: hypothetical protein VIL36_00215 [Acidimicrobiales bacterium]